MRLTALIVMLFFLWPFIGAGGEGHPCGMAMAHEVAQCETCPEPAQSECFQDCAQNVAVLPISFAAVQGDDTALSGLKVPGRLAGVHAAPPTGPPKFPS